MVKDLITPPFCTILWLWLYKEGPVSCQDMNSWHKGLNINQTAREKCLAHRGLHTCYLFSLPSGLSSRSCRVVGIWADSPCCYCSRHSPGPSCRRTRVLPDFWKTLFRPWHVQWEEPGHRPLTVSQRQKSTLHPCPQGVCDADTYLYQTTGFRVFEGIE